MAHLQSQTVTELGRTTEIDRLDPRGRIVAACVFAGVVVALTSAPALLSALGLAIAAMGWARLPVGPTLRKVAAMDGFILVMLALLPFTTPGEAVFVLGPFPASYEGIALALTIAVKANAVVMALLALVGTMEAPTLGHALHRLRLPESLVLLILFTVRYIDVIRDEYRRLRTAMRARGFKPGNNLHTYRSIGYLLGMMLVRSLERSERILAAMKCRGFEGRFPLLDALAWHRRDSLFLACAVTLVTLLLVLDRAHVVGV